MCQCVSLLRGKEWVIQRQRGLSVLSRASAQLPRDYEPAHALGLALPEAARLLLHHWGPAWPCRAQREDVISPLAVMISLLTAQQLGQKNAQLFW